MARKERPWCSGRSYRDRAGWGSCANRAVVNPDGTPLMRDGKPYCRIHDPARVAAAEKAREERHRQRNSNNERVLAEAADLSRRLGVQGVAEYDAVSSPSNWGYRERLILTFEDVRRLLKELGR